MISHSRSFDKNPQGRVKCAICNKKIEDQALQVSICLSKTCNSCIETFTEKDIELMIHMFKAYGGHFGKFSIKESFVGRILRALVTDLSKHNTITTTEVGARLLHKALLYGIKPDQLINKLKIKFP